ncbi:uncharacterized protein V3H82_004703 [Fundulus diaphanus]
MEDMEIDDSTDNGMYNLMGQGYVQGRKHRHRCVAICLGLLCTILLAGNIGQVVYYKMNRLASTDAPCANYNALNQNRKDILKLLQTGFNDLRKENEDLQTRCINVTNSTDMFKTIDKMTEKRNAKCYFVSTAKKNWTESRRSCIAEGADLLIINSDEEQKFANGMLNKEQNAWIGLTDSLTEGVWTWVDGTPVTTTYWETGQPNSHGGDQDCGELVQSELNGGWNDDGCFAQQLWICEK